MASQRTFWRRRIVLFPLLFLILSVLWLTWMHGVEGRVARLETACWRGEIESVRPDLERLLRSPARLFMPPLLQGRTFGLAGDLELHRGNLEGAKWRYGVELFFAASRKMLVRGSGWVSLIRNPVWVLAVDRSELEVPELPDIEPFDDSGLTCHLGPPVKPGENAYSAACQIPALEGYRDLQLLAAAVPSKFEEEAARLSGILRDAEPIEAAWSGVVERFSGLQNPPGAPYARIDQAVWLFAVRFRLATRSGDFETALANHRKMLKTIALVESDGSLVTTLVGIAWRLNHAKMLEYLDSGGTLPDRFTAGLAADLAESRFDPKLLERVAAREYEQARLHCRNAECGNATPDPSSYAGWRNFRANWEHCTDEELCRVYSKIHAGLTGPGGGEMARPDPWLIALEGYRDSRRAFYWPHPHAGMTGRDAQIHIALTSCKTAARIASAVRVPHIGKIRGSALEADQAEAAILRRWESQSQSLAASQ